MLRDKMRETDWELTQEQVEEQVARQSYVDFLKDKEKRKKSSSTAVSQSNNSKLCTVTVPCL